MTSIRPALSLSLLCISLVFTGCATTSSRPAPPENDEALMTHRAVEARMSTTLSSIEQHLNVLVLLERGDAPPRPDVPLSDTVAGETLTPPEAPRDPAIPEREAPRPSSEQVHPQNAVDMSPEASRARIAAARQALETEIEVTWTGAYSTLLRDIAEAIDFEVVEKGKGTLGSGTLNAPRIRIVDILETLARRVGEKAELRVILDERRFEVVYP